MAIDYEKAAQMDASRFVLLADYVPGVVQEIRYYSTNKYVGDRRDSFEEPVTLLTKEAAQALRAVSDDLVKQGIQIENL